MGEQALEILESYGSALAACLPWLLIAVAAALAYTLAAGRWTIRWPRWAPLAALVAIAACALAWAWHLRWIGDDAFISFRYARNWADGHGLVFNLGERVEGYTDFLWTAMLALAAVIGLDIPTTAIVLGLASHVAVLWLMTRLVRQLAPTGRPVIASLAAIAYAASYLGASFATGGLETTFGALLVLGALDRARAGRLLASGCLGIAATLAHPDHGIFYLAIGGVLALRRTAWRQLAWYAAPLVVVYVPYFVARWQYYGMLLPNTYYAKLGGGWYFSQGSLYVLASAVGAGLVGVVPAACYGAAQQRRDVATQAAAIAVPLYVLYVAKIGGDYMLGRLLVPIVPLVLVYAEVGVRTLIGRDRLAAGALCVAASLACVPTRILEPAATRWYLADERTFYPLVSLQALALGGNTFQRAAILDRYFAHRGSPVSYAAFAIGVVGWLTDWRIVDIHGIVDPELARQPVVERGRPGHEHTATPSYVASKHPDLSAIALFDGYHGDLTRITIEGEVFYLAHYRADLLDPLRDDPRVKLVRFPEAVDSYTASMSGLAPEAIAQDVAFFDRYYFATQPDPVRRARLSPR